MNILDTNQETEKKLTRPVFLTVLGILTFVGVGLGIIFNLYWLAFLDSFGFDKAEVAKTFALLSITGNILCLFAVLLMWKLRKSGFFIYLIGQLIPLMAHFISWGELVKDSFGLMTFFMFHVLIPLTFIILYSANLKHLK